MKTAELIRNRRSVRTFDGQPVSPDDAEAILSFANAVETPYGIPVTWRILDAKEHGLSSPVIAGTDTYFAGKLQRCPHAEEAFGFAMEKIVLFAADRGLGTTWIAGTMDRAAFERAMQLEPGEVMPCITPLGYPAGKMSVRETLMRKGVKADSRLPFEELFFNGGFDTPLSREAAGDLADALELVRLSPSAVNRQPWRVVVSGDTVHFYEKRSKGFLGKDGWDLQKIDLGIAICHFVLGMEEQQRSVEFVIEDPGIPSADGLVYIASCHVA